MCAGSLAPGCRILGIFATRSQVYGALGCHLACLVPLLWRPGGPWDDPAWDDLGTLGSTGKDTFGFGVDLGSHFESFLGTFGPRKVFLFMLTSRLLVLMVFGFESGCLGWENQAFGKGSIAKINFRRNWISHDSRVNF